MRQNRASVRRLSLINKLNTSYSGIVALCIRIFSFGLAKLPLISLNNGDGHLVEMLNQRSITPWLGLACLLCTIIL